MNADHIGVRPGHDPGEQAKEHQKEYNLGKGKVLPGNRDCPKQASDGPGEICPAGYQVQHTLDPINVQEHKSAGESIRAH